eukprot:Em0735g1a
MYRVPLVAYHFQKRKVELGQSVKKRSCISEAVARGVSNSETTASSVCCGCGACLQSKDPSSPGFIPEQKCPRPDPHRNEEEGGPERKQLVCQRCFSLKHYNTALNITLKMDDYVRHLAHIKGSRVLVLLMVDVADFPGSLFPELNTFITAPARVMVVANKIDLLPSNVKQDFFNRFSSYIVRECSRTSLAGCDVVGVHFVSAKTGEGVCKLTDAIHTQWGNRGDVYLLGCTNVGKSSLFNLLLSTLCGARPGELQTTSNVSAPMATVSNWPEEAVDGIAKAKQREHADLPLDIELLPYDGEDGSDMFLPPKGPKLLQSGHVVQPEDALVEVGLHQRHCHPNTPGQLEPKNRFWLYDTPGAINDVQLINILTTEELRLGLPKKPLKPRTFIMKPDQTLFLGGLGRLDYTQGEVSVYITVFAASYLPVHVTRTDKADSLYSKNIGGSLLKVPCGDAKRLSNFPPLEPKEVEVTGVSWKQSAADIVLSSAGWMAVTIGTGQSGTFLAYTPLGKGIFVRSPPLFPVAVNSRGEVDKGNRSVFRGK